MTHAAVGHFYETRKSAFDASLLVVNRKINAISNLRLLVAVIILVILYLSLRNHGLFYALPLLLLLFVVLVWRHTQLFAERLRLECLKKIQINELDALSSDFSANSSGSEFIDPHHPYSYDLDIFGEGSLFQYINRSSTRGGKRLLAAWLSGENISPEKINLRQEAVRELGAGTDFRHEIQALAMQVDEAPDDEQQLLQWTTRRNFVFGKPSYRFILVFVPLLTLSLVTVAFFIDGTTSFAVLAVLLQWVIRGFHRKRIDAFHQYVSGKKNQFDKYARILSFIAREKFSSALMSQLKKQAQDADEKVGRLASLLRGFDARLNAMTNLVVNSLFLYDLQCVYRLERWKNENGPHLVTWLQTVRETEAMCSVATFAFNHPQFAFPNVNDRQHLSAIDIGHPLIPERERVVNNVDLDSTQSVMIITGANMAGKSTFLRSLGVNVVLALAGAPVCAREFHCPLISLRSGMRTADSLKENQSYFYAELSRLKAIMDELRNGEVLLILLDEILKGTNSTDKQAGSIALVKQLVDHSCLVLIATHDLALGDLEDAYAGRVVNYCFEADIRDDQLSFDYKLRRGRAHKMNATFLMRKMGILDSDSNPDS
jgi:DNA mismatch repair ATPase MutS